MLVDEGADPVAPVGLGRPRLKSMAAAYQQQCQLAMSAPWADCQARSRSSPARHRESARRRSSCSEARARPSSARTSAKAPTCALDAGNEERGSATRSKQVAREHGGLDIVFANAGISGGFAVDIGADSGRLGRDPARQPHRSVPRDQICCAADERAVADRSSAPQASPGCAPVPGEPLIPLRRRA